jgi:hypothetical protein
MSNITQDTMALMKAALKNSSPELAKAVTTTTGLTYYDLQAPAKNLYPTITKLRNRTPRVGRPTGYGTQANWKVVSAITGSGFDAMGWIPEGQRSAAMSYTTYNASAPYVTIGEEDYLTFEAESAGEGFEDLNATVSMRLLQKMMRKEESGLLAGNASVGGVALGTPSTPSLSASGTGATLPGATYYVIVVALSPEGYLNNKGSVANGFIPQKTITGMDGSTYTLNGGNSNKSGEASQAVTAGQTLFASIAPVNGAVAYCWFVGTASGSETLQAITTINSVTFTAPLATGMQAISTVTADCSQNALAFSGYLINAFAGGTVTVQPTGTAGTGTPLTASGRGSIDEIDTMLMNMWNNYRLGPTVIYVSSQEQKNITDKVLSNASGPLLRYDVSATPGQPYAITAGGQIRYYYNPFVGGGMDDAGGGDMIPVAAHPDLMPGTLLAICEKLPEWYQSNEVPNTAEVITRRDYYRVDWPLRTRRREYGIYAEEVLAVYAPFALGVITNIANG